MPDFTCRSTQDEMMDDFTLGADVIDPIMDELEVINKRLGGYRVFYDAFGQIGLHPGMSISDWGCGGGDSLREIAGWARNRRLELRLKGIDATPSAVDYARKHSASYPEISYALADVLSDRIDAEQFDVVISSLFTHHFKEADWIRLVRKMYSCARRAVIINDLHRHWFAYYAIGVLTRLFSKSPMVKHDSKVSVLRGFRRQELERMLEKAGITNYSIQWKWAFRWQVILYK